MNNQFRHESYDFIDSNKQYYCGPNIKATNCTLLMKYVLMKDIKYVLNYLNKSSNVLNIINKQNSIGWTALMIAVFNATKPNNMDIIKCLIDYKADINHKSITLDTPLLISSIKHNCNYHVIKLLILNSANINDVDDEGNNALNLIKNSVGYGFENFFENNVRCIKLLLDNKCNPFMRNNNGIFAASLLLDNRNIFEVTLLRQVLPNIFNNIVNNTEYFKDNIEDIFYFFVSTKIIDNYCTMEEFKLYINCIVKYIKMIYITNQINANIITKLSNPNGSYIFSVLFKNNLVDKHVIQNVVDNIILDENLIETFIEYDIDIKYTDSYIMNIYYRMLFLNNLNTKKKQIILKNLENLNILYEDTDVNLLICTSEQKYTNNGIDICLESTLNALDKKDYYFKFAFIDYRNEAIISYIRKRETKIKKITDKFNFTPKCNILNNDNIIFMLLLITKYIGPYTLNNNVIKKVIIPLLYTTY